MKKVRRRLSKMECNDNIRWKQLIVEEIIWLYQKIKKGICSPHIWREKSIFWKIKNEIILTPHKSLNSTRCAIKTLQKQQRLIVCTKTKPN